MDTDQGGRGPVCPPKNHPKKEKRDKKPARALADYRKWISDGKDQEKVEGRSEIHKPLRKS